MGGSNFGELLGAALILMTTHFIPTPFPYIRLGAICLLACWAFVLYLPDTMDYTSHAWKLAPIMSMMAFGWSAGYISVASHLQGYLIEYDRNEYTTPLTSVMAFLHIINLALYFVISNIVGFERDLYVRNGWNLNNLFLYIGGLLLSVCAIVIFAGSFIPRGSWELNPKEKFVKHVKILNDEIGNVQTPSTGLPLQTQPSIVTLINE